MLVNKKRGTIMIQLINSFFTVITEYLFKIIVDIYHYSDIIRIVEGNLIEFIRLSNYHTFKTITSMNGCSVMTVTELFICLKTYIKIKTYCYNRMFFKIIVDIYHYSDIIKIVEGNLIEFVKLSNYHT